MNLEITGRLIEVFPTQQVSDRFQKREFIIEMVDETPTGSYTNFAKMQLAQARCGEIDKHKVGDTLKVQFNIKGNRYEKDGKVGYITSLDAWKIEKNG